MKYICYTCIIINHEFMQFMLEIVAHLNLFFTIHLDMYLCQTLFPEKANL